MQNWFLCGKHIQHETSVIQNTDGSQAERGVMRRRFLGGERRCAEWLGGVDGWRTLRRALRHPS